VQFPPVVQAAFLSSGGSDGGFDAGNVYIVYKSTTIDGKGFIKALVHSINETLFTNKPSTL
jgi:hypothetical protein